MPGHSLYGMVGGITNHRIKYRGSAGTSKSATFKSRVRRPSDGALNSLSLDILRKGWKLLLGSHEVFHSSPMRFQEVL